MSGEKVEEKPRPGGLASGAAAASLEAAAQAQKEAESAPAAGDEEDGNYYSVLICPEGSSIAVREVKESDQEPHEVAKALEQGRLKKTYVAWKDGTGTYGPSVHDFRFATRGEIESYDREMFEPDEAAPAAPAAPVAAEPPKAVAS